MTTFLINAIIQLISFIDSFVKTDEKLIHSFRIDGIKVLTDTGFSNICYIHETKPFDIYTIHTEEFFLQAADTHICFDENLQEKFVKDFQVGDYIMTEKGPQKICNIEHDYTEVCMCDVTVNDDNHRYYTNGILSHNTTSSAIFMLWYLLFNTDKNALVLGNKRLTAVEILSKLKSIFLELPYFMKPGIYKWNEAEICFDNGCRCLAEATTINSGISFTFHCVLADEFAHIPPNIKESFYNNLFPTITAAKARFMITSTQNGIDLFARLYIAAQNGENEYAPFETNWWEVPEWNPETRQWEKRDETWHQQQVGNLGGEENFQKQFGCSFITSSSTLISSKKLDQMKREVVQFIPKDIYCDGNQFFLWHPDYDPASRLREDIFVITVDIAEGINQDYTTFTFNRLQPSPVEGEVLTDAVGYFHCNQKSIKECAYALCDICNKYMQQDRYLINIEYNTYGAMFVKCMVEDMDKYDMVNITRANFIKYYNEGGTRFTYGCKLNHSSKNLACKNFKEEYEKGNIRNVSLGLYNEAIQFVDLNGNGKFAASFGHDDIIMSQINLMLARENQQYKYFVEDLLANTGAGGSDEDISYSDMYSMLGNTMSYNAYNARLLMSDIKDLDLSDNPYNF